MCGRLGGLAPCLCLCPCCKSLWGRGGACGQLLGSLCHNGLRCARAWGSTFCGWLGRRVVDLVCLGSTVRKGSSVRGVVEACGASDLACGGPGLHMCCHGWASSISPLPFHLRCTREGAACFLSVCMPWFFWCDMPCAVVLRVPLLETLAGRVRGVGIGVGCRSPLAVSKPVVPPVPPPFFFPPWLVQWNCGFVVAAPCACGLPVCAVGLWTARPGPVSRH